MGDATAASLDNLKIRVSRTAQFKVLRAGRLHSVSEKKEPILESEAVIE